MPRILFLLIAITATAARAADLTVTHISRLPEIDYVWASSNPAREGWPAVGQPITWRANVKNWSATDARDVAYRWVEDGREIARGSVTLKANATTAVDLPWSWTFVRHRLAFDIDVISGEESAMNNRLEVFTDALAAGFWVEQSFYDYFRANQGKLGIGSTCFENWAQRQIDLFNDMAAMAVYPETPRGVLDRWRLQKIVVVPDAALPLVPVDLPVRANEPPPAATRPDISDRSVDLEWGFRAAVLPSYQNTRSTRIDNPFYLVPILMHELGHARYLIDVYGFDVQNRPSDFVIDMTENGVPIVLTGDAEPYKTPELGMMNRSFTFIDRYSAIALNLIAGQRARRGNYNDPEDIGVFMNDLPAENEVTLRDPESTPFANADVEIFQSQLGHADAWYATDYDDVPDLRLRTDANGRVLVARCPFSNDGKIVHYWRGSNAVVIVRVKRDGRWHYGFLESRLFNLEYWRGHTLLGEYDLVAGRTSVCAMTAPQPFTPEYDAAPPSAEVTLTWSSVAGATAYNVFASVQGEPPQLIGSTTKTSLTAHLAGRVYWWIEATFDRCPPARSESYRFTTPIKPWRRAA